MKNFVILFLSTLLIYFSSDKCKGQVRLQGLDAYIDYSNINSTNSGAVNTYSEIDGSPFLNDEFQIGKIVLKDGKTYQGPLRYDIYGDQIEFKNKEDEVFAILYPEQVEKVIFDDVQLVMLEPSKDKIEGGIFEIIKEGENYSLLGKYTVDLKEAQPAKPYVDPKPAHFDRNDKIFFVRKGVSKPVFIKKKKDMEDIDPSRSNKIKDFVKKEKIKPSDENDLIKLVTFLNEQEKI